MTVESSTNQICCDLSVTLEKSVHGAKLADKKISCLLYADDLVLISDTKTGLQEQLKGEYAVVPTAKICGRSLSAKIPVDMNSIFMKLYVT